MKSRLAGLLLLLLLTPTARAEVVVLIHGYLGNAATWSQSGVLQVLADNAYPLVGVYTPRGRTVTFEPFGKPGKNAVYTVNLPSTAPAEIQANWLAAYLQDIRQRHGNEPIALVAHSAGGVVARLTLVRYQPPGVDRLITIATPHLGTWRAYQALDAIDTGGIFGIVKRWEVKRRIGSHHYYTLKASRGLLHDLTPPRPGNLLYWLNAQPHPDLRYVSLIRSGTPYQPGDPIVPPLSQDMRQLVPIGPDSQAYTTPQGHLLSARDGQVIVNLLAEPRANETGSRNPSSGRHGQETGR